MLFVGYLWCGTGNYGGVPEYIGWASGEWRKQPQVLEDRAARAQAAELAQVNLPRCVVGDMSDEAGSTLLIQHFFPWIQFQDLPRLNTRDGHTAGVAVAPASTTATTTTRTIKQRMHDPLSPEVTAALEERYSEEVALYKLAKQVHDDQVAYVRSLRQ